MSNTRYQWVHNYDGIIDRAKSKEKTIKSEYRHAVWLDGYSPERIQEGFVLSWILIEIMN